MVDKIIPGVKLTQEQVLERQAAHDKKVKQMQERESMRKAMVFNERRDNIHWNKLMNDIEKDFSL